MKPDLHLRLTPADYERISSRYFNEGRQQERWTLGDIDICGTRLQTTAAMTSTYMSPTDAKGFHLSVFTALEIVSQLHIIYAHAWAGLREKTREGWMIECSNRISAPVRNAGRMEVDMNVSRMRKLGDNLFCIADYRITDDTGGLFELRIKALS